MSRLFIIGNGFDIAHRIPSSYDDFRKFLIDKINGLSAIEYSYDYDFRKSIEIYDKLAKCSKTYPYGSSETYLEKYLGESDMIKAVLLYISITEKNAFWSKIEESIGNYDFKEIKKYCIITTNEGISLHNEDIIKPYTLIAKQIPKMFSCWVNSLDSLLASNNIRYGFFESQLNSHDTIFLNFNYTDTLERFYGVNRKNICYVHGKTGSTELLFGHSSSLHPVERLEGFLGMGEGMFSILHALEKPVERQIRFLSKFLSKFSMIDEVYSFGFSYGISDISYVRKIVDFTTAKSVTGKLFSLLTGKLNSLLFH